VGFAEFGRVGCNSDENQWKETREEMIQPRAEIARTSAAHHGAPDYTELEILGISPDEVLDFSVNSNPYGPSPKVQEALRDVLLDRYPDRDSVALRRELSRRFNMHPNRILVGNGTSELIQMLCFAYLERGDKVLALAHSFGEYQRAASLMGARFSEFQTSAEDDFRVDIIELGKILAGQEPKIFFLCNPNNPTGTMLPADAVTALVKAFPQTLFAIDEAYMAFADADESVITGREENLLVLRSMTKDYALAGLRLGYAVGCTDIIQAVQRVRPAWNVNAMAQAAGLAAIGDEAYLQKTMKNLRAANLDFRKQLETLGAELLPSSVHYFLMRVGNAAACRSDLLKERIQVRDCFSFDLPAYIRIATKKPEENERLLEVLEGFRQRRGELVF
jgi:histidinol-phosphate aminotransferase